MKITIQEVAEKANVSVATVSRVMNGNYPVKKETREAVLKAVDELNYIPNMQARELTKQKSTTIGVVVPSITNMFFPEVVNGIENHLKKNYFSIILSCTHNDFDTEKDCINNLISRNVSGIIVVGPRSDVIESKFYNRISTKIPLVFINSQYADSNISCVCNDESKGAIMALQYLLDNNHKDILFIRGQNIYSYDIKEKAYTDLLKKLQYFNENNIINIGDGNSSKTVDNTLNKMLEILPSSSATAVFACNDLMAVGVLNACKKLKIKVPDDIAIIGYDNIPLSKFVEPKLTTVDQNMFLLGVNAAMLLIEKIESDNEYSKQIILNNTLIKRETT